VGSGVAACFSVAPIGSSRRGCFPARARQRWGHDQADSVPPWDCTAGPASGTSSGAWRSRSVSCAASGSARESRQTLAGVQWRLHESMRPAIPIDESSAGQPRGDTLHSVISRLLPDALTAICLLFGPNLANSRTCRSSLDRGGPPRARRPASKRRLTAWRQQRGSVLFGTPGKSHRPASSATSGANVSATLAPNAK
jgi:hypothetical protein